MAKPLSDTMRRALEFARAHDGKLHRHRGGLWGPAAGPQLGYFGTSTINALVARGLAEYSAFKENQRGRFPVEITITEGT